MSTSEISSIVFGIDLGTTNTVISYFEENILRWLNYESKY